MISSLCLSMISAQTLRVCREGKPVPTFPDHALGVASLTRSQIRIDAVNALNLLPLSAAQRTWPDLLLAHPVANDLQQTRARRNRFRLPAPDLISAPGKCFVRRNGALEVVVFLAGNEAEPFQRRKELLGLSGFAEHQIGLAEMLMGAAVARIQHQRLLIMADSRP